MVFYFIDEMFNQFSHIDQLDLSVDVDAWCLVMRELMRERGDDGVVIRITEGSEDIRDY